MPNMTKSEFEKALVQMERLFPPPATRDDLPSAFEVASFNFSGSDGVLVLRLVDNKAETKDVRLNQAISVELLGHLAKVLHRLDWMDSVGKPSIDPDKPEQSA